MNFQAEARQYALPYRISFTEGRTNSVAVNLFTSVGSLFISMNFLFTLAKVWVLMHVHNFTYITLDMNFADISSCFWCVDSFPLHIIGHVSSSVLTNIQYCFVYFVVYWSILLVQQCSMPLKLLVATR